MTVDPTQPPSEEASPALEVEALVAGSGTPETATAPAEPDGIQKDAEPSKPRDETPSEAADAEAAAAGSSEDPPTADNASDNPAEPPPTPNSTTAPARRKIKIGSRQSDTGDKITSSRPLLTGMYRTADEPRVEEEAEETLAAEVEKPKLSRGKVPLPRARDPLPAELEREIDAALADASLGDISATDAEIVAGDGLDQDSHHRATIIKIHGDDVFFSLGGRNQGVVSLRQFREPPSTGEELEVVVRGFNAEDGLYELTVPGASVDVQDWSDLVEGTVVEARVTGSNTGGLECMAGNIRGFIPASQIEMYRVENYAEYYEKKLLCVVTEANKRRRNLVLSHRAVIEREKEEQRRKLLEELEVGQVVEGVVSSIRDFGAFVDIGGLDGLVHVSQLSWDRVGHPSEVLEVGQKVRVKIEKVDRESGKIGLTYRDLLEHPWTNVEERIAANSIVKGTVTRTATFGAFVKLAPGIEGLIHISELAHHRVVQVTNVVNEGDEVEVKVLSVDPEAQRISLSLKEAHAAPEPEEKVGTEEQAPDEPPRQPIVPKRHSQLKGGTDRSSGGDDFGLKW